jgi:PAS domain S-box-containing protein
LANHTVLIRKDKTERPIDDSAAPIQTEDGAIAGVVLVFRDISERRRRELAIGRLAAIVDTTSDAIISKDLHSIVMSWNPAAERMFGYTAKEMIGQPITVLFPEDHLDEEPEILRRITQGEIVSHFETVRRRKDGTIIPLSVTISPVHDATGRVIGASQIARDITEQKQADQALRQALSELSEADRRKSEFLATLSHELRNPLAPIRNAVEILKVVSADGNPEAAKPVIGLLERHVRQVARLVDDLLDVSRISRGKIELRPEVMELAPVVKQAVETVQSSLKSREHELSIVLPPQPVYLYADPNRVAQMIANLLDNACKFTERGGRIRISVTLEGGAAVVRVQDTGIGIPAEQIPQIFHMFAQANTSLDRLEGGLGIGLALVKTLAEMHGGTVEAHSLGVDQGSEFILRLPVAHDRQIASRQPERVDPQPTTAIPRRILVVDDNQDAANTLAMLLKVSGHQVDTAHDGPDAIDAALSIEPDVILLDIGLPILNGYEVARRIREKQKQKRPALIALTGWGQEEDRRRSREAGFDAHLVKPVDFAVLNKLLAELPAKT